MRMRSSLAAVCVLATSALGHVFWLQPSNFAPTAGEVVKLQLRVGDQFPGEVVPRSEARIVRFQAWHAHGSGVGGTKLETVMGRDGRDPAGVLRVNEPGPCVIAYESNASAVTLPAEKFETYLREKGLEKIVERRKEKGESHADGREEYSRCAKAIIDVGGTSSTGFDHVIGMRYEIVPTTDPNVLQPGTGQTAMLTVRCLFEGTPVANAMVEARSPQSSEKITARTNSSGEASLTIPAAGMWVVDSVEMIENPTKAADSPQWQSFWASLTFSCGTAKVEAQNAATGSK